MRFRLLFFYHVTFTTWNVQEPPSPLSKKKKFPTPDNKKSKDTVDSHAVPGENRHEPAHDTAGGRVEQTEQVCGLGRPK